MNKVSREQLLNAAKLLSHNALKLFLYLATLPEEDHCSLTEVIEDLGMCEEEMKSAECELVFFGYVKTVAIQFSPSQKFLTVIPTPTI